MLFRSATPGRVGAYRVLTPIRKAPMPAAKWSVSFSRTNVPTNVGSEAASRSVHGSRLCMSSRRSASRTWIIVEPWGLSRPAACLVRCSTLCAAGSHEYARCEGKACANHWVGCRMRKSTIRREDALMRNCCDVSINILPGVGGRFCAQSSDVAGFGAGKTRKCTYGQ